MGLRQLCRLNKLLMGGVLSPKSEVGTHAVIKDKGVLADDGDLGAPTGEIELPHIYPINANLTRFTVIEASD